MKLIEIIQKHLTPDLLHKNWKSQKHPLQGHCYVATETLYYFIPNKQDYKIMCAPCPGGSHWYLQDRKSGEILDCTKEQFENPPYELGKGKGFLTKEPSKRAKILIKRIKDDRTEDFSS